MDMKKNIENEIYVLQKKIKEKPKENMTILLYEISRDLKIIKALLKQK